MKTLHDLLHDADPLTREPVMTRDDAERMRLAILRTPQDRPKRWSVSLVLASALALMLAVLLDRQQDATPTAVAGGSGQGTGAVSADTAPARRQLQFATPGGTRVIWVFDSNFDVR